MGSMNMNGWDIISLVNISFINSAIQAQGSSPSKLEVSTDVFRATASLGTWQINVGGSANILMFSIPITDMNGSVSKKGEVITEFKYPTLLVSFQLVLTFVDHDSSGHQLVVDHNSPPTSIISLVDNNGKPLTDAMDDAFIKQILKDWLTQNLSAFNHVFATVALEADTNSDARWSFCKPSVVAYTYISGNTLANSYLCLMYNTLGNPHPGTVAQIDPSFIPPGSQAAFMISPDLFLTQFLSPAAAHQFNIDSSMWTTDTTHSRAYLNDGKSVKMAQVQSSGHWYTPWLTNFKLDVENSIITTYAKTWTQVVSWDIGPWHVGDATAYNESQSWMSLGLDGSGGNLVWTNTRPSINNHWIVKSAAVTIVQDILEVIGIALVILASILTDGAALLVVGVLFGVAGGGIQFAMGDFESRHKNDAPEVDNLSSEISLPTKWTNAGPFKASQVGLYQGGFFLAGSVR